ncbi:hypothetical protein EUGRSUZ_L01845 [Eucalyptus grandis]|uniref:Uncharacterized protein n=1 Tax=Eucalyptus grandis TaxID=71139 RepID=A0A058ZUB2_EUCGR|nr:hypothetical protein EUGRSUZ_L01845 [Eucalyptus grandis]
MYISIMVREPCISSFMHCLWLVNFTWDSDQKKKNSTRDHILLINVRDPALFLYAPVVAGKRFAAFRVIPQLLFDRTPSLLDRSPSIPVRKRLLVDRSYASRSFVYCFSRHGDLRAGAIDRFGSGIELNADDRGCFRAQLLFVIAVFGHSRPFFIFL